MRTYIRLPRLLGFALLCGPSVAAAADAPAAPAPPIVDKFHHDQPFIDDPFAISDDGTHIAYITTDGATKSQVHLAVIGDKASAKEFPYSAITPERVFFLDKERVLVIERNPQTTFARGEVFGPKGSAKEKFGPATDIGLTVVNGTPAIVTYMKSQTARGDTHTLAAFRTDTLKPMGKKVFVENSDGRVKLSTGLYKPLYFEDGYSELVARKEGAYDKVKDFRLPDLEARVDVFSEKVLKEREIGDIVAFEQFLKIRKPHQADRSYVRWADDLRVYQLIDQDDNVSELHPVMPIRKYDPVTLAYQPDGRDALTVSLTIDPVNPDAVKAQKADQDWLEIYHLDVKSKQLTQIARLDGQKRPTSWRLGGGRLGVLRKHKGFGRGGADLEVFEIAPPPKAAAPVEVAPNEKQPSKAEEMSHGSSSEKAAASATPTTAGTEKGARPDRKK